MSTKQASNPPEPLRWQKECLAALAKRTQNFKNATIIVVPGGGKTLAALFDARRFLDEHPGAVLIVVVNTVPLQKQWKDEARDNFKIQLDIDYFNGVLREGFHGIVITYQSILSRKHIFRKFCSDHKENCLVIFDEIHHLAEPGEALKQKWGVAAMEAFQEATRWLSLTGTPFRSDRLKIPFQDYEKGVCVAHYSYDRRMALRDKIIRKINFEYYDGSCNVGTYGGEEPSLTTFNFDDDLSEEESRERLRWILEPNKWTESALRIADAQLNQYRHSSRADAGGLVVCIDINHAQALASIMHSITGEKPDIIVSDPTKSTCTVDEFRKSKRKWVFAVKQISEGIDIKRLMVLCYMTTTLTEVFFQQVIGRISRYKKGDPDNLAYALLPADPYLRRFAERVMDFQGLAIEEAGQEAYREALTYHERNADLKPFKFLIDSTEASLRCGNVDGITYNKYTWELLNQAWTKYPNADRSMVEDLVQMTLESARNETQLDPASNQHQPLKVEQVPDLNEQYKRLRVSCSDLTSWLARLQGTDEWTIHTRYIRKYDKKQEKLDFSELMDKEKSLMAEINEELRKKKKNTGQSSLFGEP